MKFKPPLKQYLFHWFREKSSPSEDLRLGGVIIAIDEKDITDRLKFIHTHNRSGYNTGWWKTNERDGSLRNTFLEEYVPTKEERRHALRTIFILANEDGTIE